MSEQKKSREGPPIWVESLLTTKEYAEEAKKYPKTCQQYEQRLAQYD